jgi:hypothetical protein
LTDKTRTNKIADKLRNTNSRQTASLLSARADCPKCRVAIRSDGCRFPCKIASSNTTPTSANGLEIWNILFIFGLI